MKLLIGTLIWEAICIAAILISKPRTASDRWLGACIVASVFAASGAIFLLIAVGKLAERPNLLWLSLAWGVTYAAALRIEVMNRRENSGYKPSVEPLFPIAVVIFLGLFLFSFIE